jgi:hypothetical protein
MILILRNPEKAEVDIRFDLTQEDNDTLNAFLSSYSRLCNSKPVREGVPCKFKICFKAGEGTQIVAEHPDDDSLAVLLHRLRPFILNRERGSFERVMGIIARRIDEKTVRSILRFNHGLYKGQVARRQLEHKCNGTTINSEDVLQLWLNGHEYHGDSVKRDSLTALLGNQASTLEKGLWAWLLLDKLAAIHNLAGIVEVIVGSVEEFRFGDVALVSPIAQSSVSQELENA